MYVFLALFPWSGWGLHLGYLEQIGCGGVLLLMVFCFLIPFVYLFHGLPSGLYWLFASDIAWKSHLEKLSQAKLRQAPSKARLTQPPKLATAQEPLSAEREKELAQLYGGKVSYIQLVRERKICLGMSSAAVKASWGEPAAVKEEISAKRKRARFFYGKLTGARGKVSYRHEIVLLNDRVVEMNDL